MRQRGRKAASSVPVVIQGRLATRPEPPDDLTPTQAKIWRSIVASEAPEFFGSGALRDLLSDYCRRRETANNLSGLVNATEAEWAKSPAGLKRFGQLLQLRDLEVKGATSLATKLRLTNQSRYSKNAAAIAARNEREKPPTKPWEL